VAGRASVWSDPRVVALAGRFVPAADEVWRLQRGADADCRFFQRLVNGGEPIEDDGTRQGIWVASPSGRLLASINSLDADAVLAVLERGLAAWDELADDERRLPDGVALDPEHRWEHGYPEGGLVLERVARDLPASGDFREEPTGRWNRDYAWFTADEARRLVPADAGPGTVWTPPAFFARRLARFHLVDNVRGQTLPYADEEVLRAELGARVLERHGARLELELRGATRAVADGTWRMGENLWQPRRELPRGIELGLVGRATWDAEAARFDAFELVALGRRWGHTENNGRWRDPEPATIGFCLSLAPPDARIAPTFVAVYDGDWIEPPANPGRAGLPLGACAAPEAGR